MATLEDVKTSEMTISREAQLHNAGIQERYRRLRDAEERQFAQPTQNATNYQVRASVLAPEKPTFSTFDAVPTQEQIPQVTEYVRERIQSPLFTTEKFQAMGIQAPTQMEIAVQTPVETPVAVVQSHVAAAVATQEEQYTLSATAKKVIAGFCATVAVLTALIGINTRAIEQKRMDIASLEVKRQELLERNAELQRRIENATSEETIREYAQSNGMIPAGE